MITYPLPLYGLVLTLNARMSPPSRSRSLREYIATSEMADAQQESHQRLLEESQSHDDADEQTHLQHGADQATPPQLSDAAHRHQCRRLYLSHALSTWNSRLFEFGAFLFLANIYPNTLLPASVYALARAASTALLSPCLGSYIDRADRLKAVRLSISTPGCHLCPAGYC